MGWALTGAKADERAVLQDILANTPGATNRHMEGRQILIGDKNYFGNDLETRLDDGGIELLRPARKGEKPRADSQFLKPLRHVIESINWTYKSHLDLERHGGRTIAGISTRVAQRVLALTATIWHNDNLGLDIRRSLTADDH
ncbi:MAG: hypothetical protein H7288_02090 [Kineosporiaceae bacterium]|nr:hypothetical protein [Aeromicrobium sp.]